MDNRHYPKLSTVSRIDRNSDLHLETQTELCSSERCQNWNSILDRNDRFKIDFRRTWDKYYASWSDHHYKLVTMDEVNNLFNPNRKTLFVEKKVTSDANGSINTNEKTQTPEVLVSSHSLSILNKRNFKIISTYFTSFHIIS